MNIFQGRPKVSVSTEPDAVTKRQGFIFGGNTGVSYEQLQQRRKVAESMMQRGGTPRNVGEGLEDASAKIAGALIQRQVGQQEGEMRGQFNDQFASVIGGFGQQPSVGGFAAQPPASGGASAGGHDHSNHQGQTHADWVRYSNQGATRNQPLQENLINALSFLPELGVSMDVVSGGQDGKGEGERRTGSTRHDHGGAADVDFYKDGRKLDWNNPADVPLFQEIVRRGQANGLTGFGAGDDYMGAGRMHIGYGDPAVWGAGGKGENAPEWLREAYSAQSQPSAPQPQDQQGNRARIAELMQLANNPLASPGQQAVVNAMLQQQMQANDPMRQLQMQNMQSQMDARDAPQPQYRQVSGSELGFEGPQAEAMYNVSPDGKATQIGGGGTNVTTNVTNTGPEPGKYLYAEAAGLPKGWRMDTETGIAERIPGGPDDVEANEAEQKSVERDRQRDISMGPTLTNIQMNIDEIGDGGMPVTGPIGALIGKIPGTAASDWRVRNEQITTEGALNEIQNMRDNSPTGGAVGQLTDSERKALATAATGLSNAQSAKEYVRAAKVYRKTMLDLAYGEGKWRLSDKGQISFDMSGGAAQPTGADFSQSTIEDLVNADLSSMTPEQGDAWEKRMMELQGEK